MHIRQRPGEMDPFARQGQGGGRVRFEPYDKTLLEMS